MRADAEGEAMSKSYQPEAGQILFGQPWQRYDGSHLLEAALLLIELHLGRTMWNIHQKEFASPFQNTGNSFKNATFQVEAYSWDEDRNQEWNFRWRDLRISWYKHFQRGLSTNRAVSPREINTMIDECLASLTRMRKRKKA